MNEADNFGRFVHMDGTENAGFRARVLIVHSCTVFGGAEIYLLQMGEALLETGCQVTVLLCNEDTPSLFQDRITSLGADVICDPFSVVKPESRFYNRRFARLLAKVRPDVVFFNKGGGKGWAMFSDLITTARLRGIQRIVAAEHSHPPPFPARRRRPLHTLRQRFHCWLQAHCLDAIVCMNRVARDILVNTGYSYPKKHLHVIYNGVDTKKFQFDPILRQTYRELHGVADKTLVLFCGRLSPEKGPDLLLKAWASLNGQERERLFLLIAGDGPMMMALQDEARRMSISDSVHFAGFCDDILGYLCACDIFVLPSRSESFGLSLAEAMAAGRYVIATKVGGVPELLSNSKIGKLIAPDSPDQLAEAILNSAEDAKLRQTVGTAAARHVRENHTLERVTSETIRVILGQSSLRKGRGWD